MEYQSSVYFCVCVCLWRVCAMNPQISELISALIAAMGPFFCVFKIIHMPFLPYTHR